MQLREIASVSGGASYNVESIASLVSTLTSIGKKESVVQTYQLKNIEDPYYIQVLFIGVICIAIAWAIRRLYMKELV